jgi:hypothetical protein
MVGLVASSSPGHLNLPSWEVRSELYNNLINMLSGFSNRFRLLHVAVAGAVLLASLPVRGVAQGDEPVTKNVGFRVNGQVVEIYYDLIASSDQVYTVSVTLRKRFDKSYVYKPAATSGDVGPAVIPGENRRITWKLTDEFPKGLPGEDCFFIVDIEGGSARPGGISTTVWIIGGAALLGGVLTAVLLSSKANKDIPPVVSSLPSPPGRP